MLDKNRINVKGLKWFQPLDDIYSLAGHFEVIAYLCQDLGLSKVSQDLTSTVKTMSTLRSNNSYVVDKDDLMDKLECDKEILKFLGLEWKLSFYMF